MNTAIRVLTAGYITPNFRPIRISIGFSTLLLLTVIVFSALSLVYVKDLYRRFYIQYQELQATKQDILTQRDKLILEKTSWSVENRIQHVAQRKLTMSIPEAIKQVDIS
jgi:cell division protein FtsL